MARLFPLHLIICAAPAFMLAQTAFAQTAFAQTAIGGASVVVNDVRGDTAGKRARIALGDRVFANQGVQTATESMAKFVFLDDTNMTLGPDSRVKLDTFVFDPQGAGKNIAVTATKGAFRFVSGKSPSDAYKLTTPHAHIGVRGTTYDVRVEAGRTLVVLQEGAVNVCLRNSARCRELTEPGQSLVVTNNDIEGPTAPASKPWDFGSLCAGRTADLCGVTQFAQVEEFYDEPVYVGRPVPFIVGAGVVLPLLHGGRRPRPGPGWRPPGGKPPSTRPPSIEGRRPADATRFANPGRINSARPSRAGFSRR